MQVSQLDVLCLGLVNVNLMIGPVDKGLFDRDVSLIDEVITIPGGDATNESVVLAKLGNRAGLVGMIGQDRFGDAIISALRENGVHTDYVIANHLARSSACAVLFQSDGSRNFATFRGANEAFELKYFPPDALNHTRILNVGSMFTMKSLDGAPMAKLLMEAQARNVITSADMKADTYHLGYQGIRCTMRHLDYFLPSYDEATYLTGETDVARMARVFLNDGVKCVAIKLGAEGCYINDGREEQIVPAFKAHAVDTTGAGDNFVAGFLHGVLRGWTVRECALFGNAVGAVSVGHIGATTGVTGVHQVCQMLMQTSEGAELAERLEMRE